MARGYTYIPWTDADEEILTRDYGKVANDVLAKQLGRTILSCRARAWMLGLSLRLQHRKVRDINLTPQDAAWLACAIDSEGCLQFRRRIKSSGTPCYQIEIIISNTDIEYLNHAKDIVGFGYIKHEKLQMNKTGSAPYLPKYTYIIAGRFAVGAVLKAVHEHLIIKKDRAGILIEAGQIPPGIINGKRMKDLEHLEMLWGVMRRMGYGRSGVCCPSGFDPIRYVYFGG